MDTTPHSQAFLHALDHTFDIEGGFNDIAADRGGATIFGISDARDGKKDGLIDIYLDGRLKVPVRDLTPAQATDIYWREYWLGVQCEQLPQPIAALLFDAAVNHGQQSAKQQLQQALNYCGHKLVVDGVLGEKSHKALAATDFHPLAQQFLRVRAARYARDAAKNKSQDVFLDGWLRRLFSLYHFASQIEHVCDSRVINDSSAMARTIEQASSLTEKAVKAATQAGERILLPESNRAKTNPKVAAMVALAVTLLGATGYQLDAMAVVALEDFAQAAVVIVSSGALLWQQFNKMRGGN